MIKLRHQQSSVWEGLFAEEVAELWEPWMRIVDELLEDEALLDAVYEAQGKRHPQSRVRGREQTPAEVTLRMLILKHVRNWSYETLEREVRANVVYRSFCRIGMEKVPDAKTLVCLGQAIGPETIAELHDPIVALAQQQGVIRGRKMHVDTTVVESNIHYPTDSGLLNDGTRVLTRTMKKIEHKVGGLKRKSPQPDAQCDQAGDRHRTCVALQGSGRRAEAQTRVSPTAALDPADSERFAESVARSRSFVFPPPPCCVGPWATAGSYERTSTRGGAADQGASIGWRNPVSRETG